MYEILTLTQIARLISAPARAAMLLALADGRALPATELACRAGISNQTTSEHLALMKKMGVLCVEHCGRHRYDRVVSPRIMEALEDMLAVSAEVRLGERPDISRVAPLRHARMCYDHLAGRLGVALAEKFQEKNGSRWEREISRSRTVVDISWEPSGSSGQRLRVPAGFLPGAALTGARGSLIWGELLGRHWPPASWNSIGYGAVGKAGPFISLRNR